MNRLSDFDYDLPPERIAQAPAAERDAARLLILDRTTGAIRHSVVRDLATFLRAGDLLVMNDSRVRAARLRGRGVNGGAVELLLVREEGGNVWQCLGKPARRLRPGADLVLGDGAGARVTASCGGGRCVVEFSPSVRVDELLALCGEVPLPPYIRRPGGATALDRERYQTVYAAREGAIAAPTAGLHFTGALLESLRASGVETAWLTLDVGPATFLPVRHEDVREHDMESEHAFVPEHTAESLRRARSERRRVVAVGTTTTRTLESMARQGRFERAGGLRADVFITPGFRFRVVDALLTNFHLPRSTLLLLVCAFAGRETVLAAYETAVREGYRFYSYGDAMLIL